jgi:hypothetical protein
VILPAPGRRVRVECPGWRRSDEEVWIAVKVVEKAPDFTLPSDSGEPGGLARGGATGGDSGFVILPRRLVERVHGPGGSGAAGDLFLRGEGCEGPGDERGLPLVAQGVGRRERQRISPAFGLPARGRRGVRHQARCRFPQAGVLRHKQGRRCAGEYRGFPGVPTGGRRSSRRPREGALATSQSRFR